MEVRRSRYVVEKTGRDGEIRTRDPLNPIQVRYQATLRPDQRGFIIANYSLCSLLFLAKINNALS